MEGTLWKWTNYFNGWQPRWFMLDNGILSYYKDEEDVANGCKGSINMAVCEVSVHATDKCRLDLIVPPEAHFYLKTSSPLERQQWLVCLGSCKASRDADALTSCPSQRRTSSTSIRDSDLLKQKKSELRLYSDLLMQQVHSLKSAALEVDLEHTRHLNEKLDDASQLLSATCDTFIHTLDEWLSAANLHADYLSELPPIDGEQAIPPSSPKRSLRIKVI